MSSISTLYVVWQDPDTSRYFPVGRLRMREEVPEDVYEFVYTKGVDPAKKHGFAPFLAFPHIDNEYLSTHLFPFFANRLLPPSREDYPTSIGRLGLSPDTASAMDVLARSGGRRTTDSVELFAPPQWRGSSAGQSQVLEYFFLLHGTRHMRECARRLAENTLRPGDPLFLLHDLQNEVDPKALALRTEGYCCIGFVPRFLTDDVWTLLDGGEQITITLEQLNPPPAPIQQRALCRMSVLVRNHFSPCSGDEFVPIAHESKVS